MRNLTTDDLYKIIVHGIGLAYYKGIEISTMNDEQVIETFTSILKTMYDHAYSKHYTTILDEPRF